MTNLLHTGHLMPFKDQMCAGSDVAAYTLPRASEAALAAAAAAASSAELLSVSGLAEDSSYGTPAPADTTSELLLVEKVLALGLDCPPFAVLAFIPISFHIQRGRLSAVLLTSDTLLRIILSVQVLLQYPTSGSQTTKSPFSPPLGPRFFQMLLAPDKILSLTDDVDRRIST